MGDFNGPWRKLPPPALPPRPKPRARLGLYLWMALLIGTAAIFVALVRFFPNSLTSLDDRARALRLFGLLALVSSGLVATRRVNLGRSLRHAAVWVAIFALGLLGYAYRGEVQSMALRLRTTLIPGQAVTQSARTVVIGRADDGGFYVNGSVNGTPVRFVIDTGASGILLSPADAVRAGLPTVAEGGGRPSETANGVGYVTTARARNLDVGPIHLSDVPIEVNQAPISVSLLGMPFLRRLDSFEVRGDQLMLHPARTPTDH